MEALLSENEKQALVSAVKSMPGTLVGQMNPQLHRDVVVEFGCGGSTLLLASAIAPHQRLISIEHNPEWATKVREMLATLAPDHPRIHVLLYEPVLKLTQYAKPLEENPAALGNYLTPAVDWNHAGVVFVDGIARGACLAMLRTRLKSGTTVFLHDYVGREMWYDWATSLYDRVAVIDTLLQLRVP